ncbi:unnamed protein product [Mytilus coruscus]|uniref:Reverse transcriptase RNase H-like domain-containing protein n=1 Tax=Mytilus coruscus TaxID=42192 RepID=A0A6J8C4C9_MYTCO|nr:unnamed protein product [Mytilus coruscus]
MEEHDEILKQVVEHATSHNLRLLPDPAKIQAIVEIPAPQNKEGVRRFLRLVQYLSKFIPNLSQVDAPSDENILKSDVLFTGEYEQDKSFQELKRLCSTTPVLAFFDVKKPVEIECDASQGLGAVLMQEGRVIAYISRSLSESEKRYAQIEKEMLSIVFSTKKFHCYIFGKKTVIHNDHKPLEQIFKKPLLAAPLRIQKMMLKLQWYDIQVCYRKGKDMNISDDLSRAFLPVEHKTEEGDIVQDMICMISISKDKYSEIQDATKSELYYRTTPLEGTDLSPSQLLMGRRPRKTLPASKKVLGPDMHNSMNVKRHFDREKEKQKFYYDKRRGVKELPSLNDKCAVRMTPLPGSKEWKPGTIVKHIDKPSSYIVQRSDSENNRLYRRNRKHLRTSNTTASKDINRETTSDNFELDNLPIESRPSRKKQT